MRERVVVLRYVLRVLLRDLDPRLPVMFSVWVWDLLLCFRVLDFLPRFDLRGRSSSVDEPELSLELVSEFEERSESVERDRKK